MRVLLACLTLAGCSSNDTYPPDGVEYYWDQPGTGWFWVPKDTVPSTVIRIAEDCGAKTDGAVANHGIVPPGYDYGVFKFLDPSPEPARRCTVERLGAVPALTVYEKRR